MENQDRMREITLRVHRFDPEKDEAPYFQEYPLSVVPGSSLLDALLQVQDTQDSSLTFRRSCRSAICGSCGVRANSVAVLACHTPIEDLLEGGKPIVVEPLGNLRVIKDLVVDMAPFFERVKRVQPWLVPREPELPLDRENLVFPDEDYQKLHQTIDNCILCGLCHSDCPVLREDQRFIGPGGVVKSYRFILDARDALRTARRHQLISLGLHQCSDPENCPVRCPKGISLGREVMRPLRPEK
ncbi:MAG: hypothetical protein HYY20_04630 [Candidatus Tectomicrobia bacterium]|uniref:succinate dehydrogenase n=1 Tax=Tectimicrobiota bacterium TaxID=2528274 RepID=A0A932CMG4_UNCTE|nr:hypothetical protein [Candidatus Tectomicrobia bacterium]